MKYLILSITILGTITLNSIDTAYRCYDENPLVSELEICIQKGARVKDLELYQESLHSLPLHRIAEIESTCAAYTRAITIAHELYNNEQLAEYVACMGHSIELPADMRRRGWQLVYYARTGVWPYVQKVHSDIIDLLNDTEVDDYVMRENSRIGAIQEWLNRAKVIAENKKRTDELCEEIKDRYLQQISDQNPK